MVGVRVPTRGLQHILGWDAPVGQFVGEVRVGRGRRGFRTGAGAGTGTGTGWSAPGSMAHVGAMPCSISSRSLPADAIAIHDPDALVAAEGDHAAVRDHTGHGVPGPVLRSRRCSPLGCAYSAIAH